MFPQDATGKMGLSTGAVAAIVIGALVVVVAVVCLTYTELRKRKIYRGKDVNNPEGTVKTDAWEIEDDLIVDVEAGRGPGLESQENTLSSNNMTTYKPDAGVDLDDGIPVGMLVPDVNKPRTLPVHSTAAFDPHPQAVSSAKLAGSIASRRSIEKVSEAPYLVTSHISRQSQEADRGRTSVDSKTNQVRSRSGSTGATGRLKEYPKRQESLNVGGTKGRRGSLKSYPRLSGTVHVASHSFKPMLPDELRTLKDDPISIYEAYTDSWSFAMNWRSGQSGMLPLCAISEEVENEHRHKLAQEKPPNEVLLPPPAPMSETAAYSDASGSRRPSVDRFYEQEAIASVLSLNSTLPSVTAGHWGLRTLTSVAIRQKEANHQQNAVLEAQAKEAHEADLLPETSADDELVASANIYFAAMNHLDYASGLPEEEQLAPIHSHALELSEKLNRLSGEKVLQLAKEAEYLADQTKLDQPKRKSVTVQEARRSVMRLHEEVEKLFDGVFAEDRPEVPPIPDIFQRKEPVESIRLGNRSHSSHSSSGTESAGSLKSKDSDTTSVISNASTVTSIAESQTSATINQIKIDVHRDSSPESGDLGPVEPPNLSRNPYTSEAGPTTDENDDDALNATSETGSVVVNDVVDSGLNVGLMSGFARTQETVEADAGDSDEDKEVVGFEGQMRAIIPPVMVVDPPVRALGDIPLSEPAASPQASRVADIADIITSSHEDDSDQDVTIVEHATEHLDEDMNGPRSPYSDSADSGVVEDDGVVKPLNHKAQPYKPAAVGDGVESV
ncbi:hypothetical protein HDU85_005820 [Gaertneriomyces sp. JEL0708]|nr:hypothetical protein HDU85_005820 [Gaertneriomyces sp. JEL0708]